MIWIAQQQSKIQFMQATLMNEINELIRKGNHHKAFRVLNRQIISDPSTMNLAEQMQLCRRLLYLSVKILKKYQFNFEAKAHRIQKVLFRGMEVVVLYHENIQRFIYRSVNYGYSYMVKSQQSHKSQSSQQEVQRKSGWINFHLRELYTFIAELIFHQYSFHKASGNIKEQIIVCKRLEQIVRVPEFSHQYRAFAAHTIGNRYLEIKNINQALDYYNQAFESSFYSMCKILDDFEKLKNGLSNNLWEQIQMYCSMTILHLDMMAYSSEAMKYISFAAFLYKVMQFARICDELGEYIQERYNKMKQYYGEDQIAQNEIHKIMRKIYSPQRQNMKAEPPTILETTQAQMYQKYHQHQPKLIIKQKVGQIPSEKSLIYFTNKMKLNHKKIGSNKKNQSLSTTHNISEFCEQIKHDQSKATITSIVDSKKSSNLALLNCNQPKPFSISQAKQKREPSSYLGQLLNLEQQTLLSMKDKKEQHSQSQIEIKQFRQINRTKKIPSIDIYMSQFINEKLGLNNEGTEAKVQSMQKQLKIEQQIHKEISATVSVLGMQKELGALNGTPSKPQFSKFMEMNALTELDYQTQHKDIALEQVKSTKQLKLLRNSLRRKHSKSLLEEPNNYRNNSRAPSVVNPSPRRDKDDLKINQIQKAVKDRFVLELEGLQENIHEINLESEALRNKYFHHSSQRKNHSQESQKNYQSDLALSTANQSLVQRRKPSISIAEIVHIKNMFQRRRSSQVSS